MGTYIQNSEILDILGQSVLEVMPPPDSSKSVYLRITKWTETKDGKRHMAVADIALTEEQVQQLVAELGADNG